MKMVTISGIDKSGKTAVLNALNLKTNYEHFVIERDPATVLFFAKLMNRHIDNHSYAKLIFTFKAIDPLLSVFLFTDPLMLEGRFAVHNEPPLIGNLSIKDHQLELMKIWKSIGWKYPLSISTSIISIDDTVNLIKEKLDAI